MREEPQTKMTEVMDWAFKLVYTEWTRQAYWAGSSETAFRT
jgi:hypothetical protein